MEIKKVVIDIGHKVDTFDKLKAKGTVLNGKVIEEYELNKIIAVALKNKLECNGVKTYFSEPLDSKEPEDFNKRTNGIDKYNPDLCISIHHDANNKSDVRGFTMYTWKGNINTLTIKKQITQYLKKISTENKLNSSGYSLCYPGHNNFAIVRKPKAPVILLEVGFFTNPNDVDLTLHKADEIATAITEGILNKEIKNNTHIIEDLEKLKSSIDEIIKKIKKL